MWFPAALGDPAASGRCGLQLGFRSGALGRSTTLSSAPTPRFTASLPDFCVEAQPCPAQPSPAQPIWPVWPIWAGLRHSTAPLAVAGAPAQPTGRPNGASGGGSTRTSPRLPRRSPAQPPALVAEFSHRKISRVRFKIETRDYRRARPRGAPHPLTVRAWLGSARPPHIGLQPVWQRGSKNGFSNALHSIKGWSR